MARKGQFKKGGGRVGGGHAMVHVPRKSSTKPNRTVRKAKRSRGPAREIIIDHERQIMVSPRSHASRRKGAKDVISPIKLVVVGAAMANVLKADGGLLGKTPGEWVDKIPGAKTVGRVAASGLVLGAVWKYSRFGGKLRPYLKAAGVVGLVAAALKVGEQGTGMKWLGSDDMMDVVTD